MGCTFTKFYSSGKIKKNEMSGACSTYGGEERYVQGFVWGNIKEREILEDPGIDGRIILM